MTKTTRKKKPKAQTLSEFRAWLSGVEEMQDPDWIPNKDQWELIRLRIDCIKEVEPQSKGRPGTNGPIPEQPRQDMSQPEFNVPPVQSSFDRLGLIHSVPAPSIPKDSKGPVVTPDIDTSGKPYGSGFV
jgi:hypothetical protein